MWYATALVSPEVSGFGTAFGCGAAGAVQPGEEHGGETFREGYLRSPEALWASRCCLRCGAWTWALLSCLLLSLSDLLACAS
jgi:hypothetical protein